MRRVLATPAVAAAPRAVADPRPVLDPLLARLLDEARAEGHARGLAEGHAAGHADGSAAALARLAELGQVVTAAVEGLARAVDAARADQADGVAELALAVAAHVLDREPSDQATTLVARVRGWLTAIDDGPVEIAVAVDDVDVLAAAVAGHEHVRVCADPTLAPGEARLAGPWASARLLHAARWDEVRQVLA